MFMYTKFFSHQLHYKKLFTPRCLLCLIMAVLILSISIVGQPTHAEAPLEAVPWVSSSQNWTPAMSGSEVLPAGEASLPIALTGVSARGAVLMEADSGQVIFGQNQHAKLPMASTTKIMTALVALESLPLDTRITIPPEAVGIEGSSIYLCEGEILTLEDLLYALLLESANDAAVAIALSVDGSVEAFAARMNRKAYELGLTNTHFVNPHGLDHEEHYTTAYELGVITAAALQNPAFRQICSTDRKTIPLHGEEGVRLLLNHNKLLDSFDGCIGVKTGFTKKTGRCLVSAAEREGVTLVAVTLNAPDDWRDHTAMLEYGFGMYESVTLCDEGFFSAPLHLISGAQEYVIAENTAALSAVLKRNHGPVICVVELPPFTFAPIETGETVGYLRFFETSPDGTKRELGAVPLTAAYGVDEITYKLTLWDRILSMFGK